MKRQTTLLLVLVLSLALLTSCGHSHTWLPATCTEPSHCSECGETEGVPLGHDWKDATCTLPKTCTRCGVTEGDALGHDWKDATCTLPITCARCGVTEGDALGHDWQDATCTEPITCARCGEKVKDPLGHEAVEADYWTPEHCARCGEELGPVKMTEFEKRGYRAEMQIGVPVKVELPCKLDSSLKTVADLTVTGAERLPALENFQLPDGKTVWNFPGKDGYEWLVVHMRIDVGDENSYNYGMNYNYFFMNYYSTFAADDFLDDEDRTKGDFGTLSEFTITYRGEEYEGRYLYHEANGTWEKQPDGSYAATVLIDYAMLAPVGYDGFVVGICDGSLIPEGENFTAALSPESEMFRFLPDENA